MEFTDGERVFLNEMRMLSTDNKGNEIFVGLTLEESQEYYKYTRTGFCHRANMDSLDHEIELGDKHELARHTVLAAEIDARENNSPRH